MLIETFPDRSEHLFGRATDVRRLLDRAARSGLTAVVARPLMGNPRLKNLRFVIEGHADRTPPRSRNQKLSDDRAEAVRSYLIDPGRIAGDRLRAEGKSDSEPWDLKNPSSPENRRVTFVTDSGR